MTHPQGTQAMRLSDVEREALELLEHDIAEGYIFTAPEEVKILAALVRRIVEEK